MYPPGFFKESLPFDDIVTLLVKSYSIFLSEGEDGLAINLYLLTHRSHDGKSSPATRQSHFQHGVRVTLEELRNGKNRYIHWRSLK